MKKVVLGGRASIYIYIYIYRERERDVHRARGLPLHGAHVVLLEDGVEELRLLRVEVLEAVSLLLFIICICYCYIVVTVYVYSY